MANRNQDQPSAELAPLPTAILPGRRVRFAAGVLLIVGLSLLAYWPALSGDFILDDDLLLTGNKIIHAPNGLYRFWFTTDASDYWPITNSSWWLEWRLWGMNSTGYHTVNLILHILNALLIWRILHALSIPGGFLAALLFAVHPVNVESAAWVAQRKNVLSMFFFLLSLRCYFWSEVPQSTLQKNRSTAPQPTTATPVLWYSLSLTFFLFAMLSKGSVAVLPLLLLLITWWLHGRLTTRDFALTTPFFLVAAVLTFVNIWFQSHGHHPAFRDVGITDRLLGAGAIFWFYLYKALLPLNLAFIYPQWEIQSSDWRWWTPLLAALVVTALLWRQRQHPWGRPLLVAWCFFGLALLPVLGFVHVGFMRYSLVADHYQYIALIAVVTIIAVGLHVFAQWLPHHAKIIAVVCAVVLVSGCTFLARRQSEIYQGELPLYEDTLAKNPDCWLAHNNLSVAFANHDQLALAIDQCQQALRIEPDNAEALGNLGMALDKAGRVVEAKAPLERCLSLQPDSAKAQYSLATVLGKLGQVPEALIHAQEAIRIDPDYPEAHNTYGVILRMAGRLPEALDQFQQAAQLRPDDELVRCNYGNLLLQLGQAQEAVQQYQAALNAKPNYLEACANLATAYAAAGRSEDALQTGQKALDLARSQRQSELAQQIETWLNNYRNQVFPKSQAP